MQESVSFQSAGLRITAVLHRPDDAQVSEPRPAFVLLHGFGSNKDSGFGQTAARLLEGMGYIVLRFDMRGCGKSEGPRGRVICMEQVEDTQNAVSYLTKTAGVAPDRIALLGHSFGAAVAIYTAAVDKRVAVCVSSGGWGDGEKKFRAQHSGPEAWRRFETMLAEGRAKKAKGEELLVSRFDIVPMAPELRGNLAAGSIMEFPFDVVESMYSFKANEVVGDIAPRPLLLIHPSFDSVTPTEQSIDLFHHAKQPADLHLFSGVDHFLFSEHNPVVIQFVQAWLDRFIPVRKTAH